MFNEFGQSITKRMMPTRRGLILLYGSLASLAACSSARPLPAPEPQAPPPVAQSGPSFEETRDFILSNWVLYGGHSYSQGTLSRFENASINNACVFKFTQRDYDAPGESGGLPEGYAFGLEDISIPFGALTDIKGEMNAGWPEITFSTGTTAAISRLERDHASNNGIPSYMNMTWSYIDNQPPARAGEKLAANPLIDMRDRLVQAMKHMSEICRGTYQAPDYIRQPF